VGRARWFVGTVAVLAAFACLPAVAAAANFSWSVTSDFSTSPLANPDKDSYGGHPWSYESARGAKLSVSAQTIDGSLTGWTDPSGTPFVAVPAARDRVVLQPSLSAPAVVAWTSPVSGTVTVAGSVVADQAPGLLLTCPNADWSVLKNGAGTGVGGRATTSSQPYSTQLTVSPGDRITLQVALPQLALSAGCAKTGATFTVTHVAPDPAVTLLTPANGATITSGQPTFSGTAASSFGTLGTVTVRVYSGTGTNGIPVRTIPTTVSNGTFSTSAIPPLPDGTYTAQAEQDSVSGAGTFSSSNTFILRTAGPVITLDSPGTAPLHTSRPTLTGVGAHSQAVRINVYPGGTTDSAPAGSASGTSRSDGRFSISLPALSDGRYTALATDGSGGLSHPVTFRIKVHGPILTLTQPAAGGHLSQSGPVFLGSAGNSLGDAGQVGATLLRGSSPRGTSLGTKRASQSRGSWVLHWPARLALGTYTLRISQDDDAGHTTTVTHTFQIVPANSAVGATVDISPTGQASVPVWCTATVGQVCSGTVLILTKKTYRTAAGGLAGRLRVMFAYVTIPGGGTAIVRRSVEPDVLRALRRARKVPAVVVARLRSAGGGPRTVGVSRVITVRSARHR
jgi:hypothetical protein